MTERLKAAELLSAYDDAVIARGAAVSSQTPPFDRHELSPAEILATEPYRREIAAREAVLAVMTLNLKTLETFRAAVKLAEEHWRRKAEEAKQEWAGPRGRVVDRLREVVMLEGYLEGLRVGLKNMEEALQAPAQ